MPETGWNLGCPIVPGDMCDEDNVEAKAAKEIQPRVAFSIGGYRCTCGLGVHVLAFMLGHAHLIHQVGQCILVQSSNDEA